MKLYRGIKSREFSHFSTEVASNLQSTWSEILKKRSRGDFSYPNDFNKKILAAAKLVRLQRQHFTDNKDIAARYAKTNNGVLVEVDVPTKEIIDHFTIEFQNFNQRKRAFEIVYVVDSSKLLANSRKWKLKTRNMSNTTGVKR